MMLLVNSKMFRICAFVGALDSFVCVVFARLCFLVVLEISVRIICETFLISQDSGEIILSSAVYCLMHY